MRDPEAPHTCRNGTKGCDTHIHVAMVPKDVTHILHLHIKYSDIATQTSTLNTHTHTHTSRHYPLQTHTYIHTHIEGPRHHKQATDMKVQRRLIIFSQQVTMAKVLPTSYICTHGHYTQGELPLQAHTLYHHLTLQEPLRGQNVGRR